MYNTLKLKLGFLSQISGEWFNLHKDKIEMVNNINDADYIIFESNGDPVPLIMNIKKHYPQDKLVFILSGDQHTHIDNNCIWFSNAVKQSGLAKYQYQIFVSNPAIFKFYEQLQHNNILAEHRATDIYFKGTIWTGMRTDMYNTFKDKPNTVIIENNNYWNWRFNTVPSQKDIEEVAYQSYKDILNSKLCLCPKGNGNSSMRIIEALACGSIPILINDFSKPFGIAWTDIGLVFDTTQHTWQHIYLECQKLVNDTARIEKYKTKGKEYFENIIYSDAKLKSFTMYNDINTVCFGFSNLIIKQLETLHNTTQK